MTQIIVHAFSYRMVKSKNLQCERYTHENISLEED